MLDRLVPRCLADYLATAAKLGLLPAAAAAAQRAAALAVVAAAEAAIDAEQ